MRPQVFSVTTLWLHVMETDWVLLRRPWEPDILSNGAETTHIKYQQKQNRKSIFYKQEKNSNKPRDRTSHKPYPFKAHWSRDAPTV